MKIFSSLCYAAVLALSTSAAFAQERSAGSSMDIQMTWTALSNQVKATGDKIDIVNARLNQAVKCGKKRMVYAPDTVGADGEGCISAQVDTTTIDKIVACGQQSKIFNSATNACVESYQPTCNQNTISGNLNNAAYAQKYHLQFWIDSAGKMLSQRYDYTNGSAEDGTDGAKPGTAVGYRRADLALDKSATFRIGEKINYYKNGPVADGIAKSFDVTCTANGWQYTPYF